MGSSIASDQSFSNFVTWFRCYFKYFDFEERDDERESTEKGVEIVEFAIFAQVLLFLDFSTNSIRYFEFKKEKHSSDFRINVIKKKKKKKGEK